MNFIPAWLSLVFGDNSPKKEWQRQKRILHDSPLFDSDYYKSRYLSTKATKKIDPIEHYLAQGAEQRLNPGKAFDTKWYLEQNPDVLSSGVNPLIHFILNGVSEGRSPVPDEHHPDGNSSPNVLGQKLWAGFSHLTLPKLEAISREASQKVYRVQSLWHLANWYFVQGEYQKSLDYLSELECLQQRPVKRVLISKCKCFQNLDMPETVADIVFDENNSQVMGKECTYLKINTSLKGKTVNEAKWLEEVNFLYKSQGMLDLKKAKEDQPLALNNLSPAEPLPKDFTKDLPKVSVIVPAFNAADTIGIALNSLIYQTWPNLEILVVDDASTDTTQSIVESYTSKYSNIRYLKNPINIGAYPSRNQGYINSTGEFITVHDSDDWSHPQKIEIQIRALLENPSLMVSLSNWVRINDQLAFVGPWMLCEDFVEMNHSSALISRSAIEQLGPWDEVNVAADTEFLWRIKRIYGAESMRLVKPEVPLSFALTQPGSLTQSSATHVTTIFYGLRRIYRESAAWWHECNANDGLYMKPGDHHFPCPLGNRRKTYKEFDIVVAGDFSHDNQAIDEIVKYLNELLESHRIVLFHWPDYRHSNDPSIDARVFQFCQKHAVPFTHSGNSLNAPRLILTDEDLAKWVPDSLPKIKNLTQVDVLNSAANSVFEPLKRLFTRV